MLHQFPVLLAKAEESNFSLAILGAIVCIFFAVVLVLIVVMYGKLWFRAYMSNANVSIWSLIGMSFRRVPSQLIVQGKIMAVQSGVGTDKAGGVTTRRLEAHYLAGGSVPSVIRAIIAAHRADIDLDFDRAAAIDLAGRDVLDAVQTSVNPKVIDCPDPEALRPNHLRAPSPRMASNSRSAPGSRSAPTSSSSSAGPPKRRSSPEWARASSPRSARPKATSR